MIDYEQPLPPAVASAYRAEADGVRERGGSGIMLGAAHAARQLLWFERDWPEALGRARAFLPTPQYWAWRLSGVLADEVTSAAAQSHLWCAADRRPAAIVARHGWQRLMPPMTPAWATLGPLRPELARLTGLDPATRVLCGIHDFVGQLLPLPGRRPLRRHRHLDRHLDRGADRPRRRLRPRRRHRRPQLQRRRHRRPGAGHAHHGRPRVHRRRRRRRRPRRPRRDPPPRRRRRDGAALLQRRRRPLPRPRPARPHRRHARTPPTASRWPSSTPRC